MSTKFNSKYAEYIYDNNIISNISQLYNIPHIDKNTYLKHVHQISYKKDNWFLNLYQNENNHKKEKKIIIDKSIDKFIKSYVDNIDITNLTDKFKKTQNNKIYMLYCCNSKKIYEDSISDDELTLKKSHILKKNKNKLVNSIIYDTMIDSTKINMLLRWRNRSYKL